MNNNELIENINTLYNIYIEHENNFTELLSNFYSNVDDLVKLSNGKYQVEKTIKLNKVSIKGYILESDFVKQLNIPDFKLDQLKSYLIQSQSEHKEDVLIAIQLYELLDQMEKIERDEINDIIDYIQLITNLTFRSKLSQKINMSEIYNSLTSKISEYENNNMINEELKNKFIDCLNFLFNYYINGSRNIKEQ